MPNGTYSLQSVATDADSNTDTSTPITITVNNPATAVLIPSNGATFSGPAHSWTPPPRTPPASARHLRGERQRPSGRLSPRARPPSTAGWPSGTRGRSPTAPTTCRAWPPTPWPRARPARPSASRWTTPLRPAPCSSPRTGPPSRGRPLLDASASANVTSVQYELTGGRSPSHRHRHPHLLRLAR